MNVYQGKFDSHITTLSCLRDKLEDTAVEKTKEMIEDASEKVKGLKIDLVAWAKLQDVYAPSAASEGSAATPLPGRKRKSSSEQGTPQCDREAKTAIGPAVAGKSTHL